MSTSAVTSLVAQTLEEYGALTRRALADYLPEREPHRHLYALTADYPGRGGKMLRSSLCIATARVFGATAQEAVRSAAAIELMHNAMLIHDDIEDDSEERRGRPALHVLHGVPVAINAGDMLTLLSLRPLVENVTAVGPWLALKILEETERMASQSAEGQALELGWRRDNALSLGDADYFEMVMKKTCWLMAIHPSRVGALIGTRGAANLDVFTRFGFFLGAAFQVHDDVLNLVGDTSRYGKERDGDLWEGKRTLMLLHVLRECSESDHERVGRLLGTPRARRTASEVAWLHGLMDSHGSIEHARQIAHGLAGAALHEHSLVYRGMPASRDKDFIEALPTFVLERGH